ncbi:single-stranded DNA-binding protein [uncultured Collinsella sp.]|uniref:single-stranded DNA-binding protein n=1 Tax=uncultured Collinsella sp. TaxID=165190 RepID=UPI002673D605|nr:single-stranded DNA-binding protein [uncultured Collinsella sp.]
MSINHVILSGNLGANSELRYTKSGTPILTFSLAVNDRVPNGDGTWGDYTNWPDCSMFGKRAEALAPYLTKGVKVTVSGRVRTHTYQKDGQNLKRWEIRVENVELMQVKREQQNAYAQPAEQAQPIATSPTPDVYDEDIPF